LGQRLFGLGSIFLTTSDHSAHNLEIRSVKHPKDVKEMLSSRVEEQRDKKRVVNREMMVDPCLDEDHDDYDGEGEESDNE
jgi:hypothetical protein